MRKKGGAPDPELERLPVDRANHFHRHQRVQRQRARQHRGVERAPPARLGSAREPQAAPVPETEGLSPREREVLHLLAKGYLYKEIAEGLGLGLPTVNTYVRRIYEKLHVKTGTEAVAKAIQRKLVDV